MPAIWGVSSSLSATGDSKSCPYIHPRKSRTERAALRRAPWIRPRTGRCLPPWCSRGDVTVTVRRPRVPVAMAGVIVAEAELFDEAVANPLLPIQIQVAVWMPQIVPSGGQETLIGVNNDT